MNHEQTRLRHEESLQAAEFNQSRQHNGTEFQTVDDLLRHDSGQHPVPPKVAERLEGSIAAEPKPERSWLKKFFG